MSLFTAAIRSRHPNGSRALFENSHPITHHPRPPLPRPPSPHLGSRPPGAARRAGSRPPPWGSAASCLYSGTHGSKPSPSTPFMGPSTRTSLSARKSGVEHASAFVAMSRTSIATTSAVRGALSTSGSLASSLPPPCPPPLRRLRLLARCRRPPPGAPSPRPHPRPGSSPSSAPPPPHAHPPPVKPFL